MHWFLFVFYDDSDGNNDDGKRDSSLAPWHTFQPFSAGIGSCPSLPGLLALHAQVKMSRYLQVLMFLLCSVFHICICIYWPGYGVQVNRSRYLWMNSFLGFFFIPVQNLFQHMCLILKFGCSACKQIKRSPCQMFGRFLISETGTFFWFKVQNISLIYLRHEIFSCLEMCAVTNQE